MITKLTRLSLLLLLPALLSAQVYPGLYEADGSPHPVHQQNPVTGRTISVVDFGADPADNDADDRPAIEAALQSADFGDELYFPAGVYNFNSGKPGDTHSHILPKSGVNWRGEGMAVTVLKSGFGDKTIDRFLKMRAAHNIVIANFSITSNFQGSYSTDVSVNNPQAGGPKYVISIEDDNGMPSYNITVDSVRVENYRTHGVRLSKSHDVVVRNSIFQKATDVGGGGAGYGVSIQGNKQQDNDSKFNVVEKCRFLGPYIRHGIIMQYATHNNGVRSNYCENTRLDAIDLHGEDEYLNEIYENEVRDVQKGAGVGVGNTGSTHDRSGPFNDIHDNLFVNCREGVKVYLGSPDTRIENNRITGSTVSNGKGVYILNGPRSIVRGNEIFDNTGGSFTGIYLNYDGGTQGKGAGPPRDIHILENVIYNNPYGVRLFSGERIVYQDNQVYNNTIADFYASSSVTFNVLLDVQVQGDGLVALDPPGGSYAKGAVVQATALPGANWRFDHWEGDLNGQENPAALIMDDSKKIRAVFLNSGADEVNLAVNVQGGGSVAVDPPGRVHPRGRVVTLIATADSAWEFIRWQGDLNSTNATDTLLLDQDKQVTAVFEKLPTFKVLVWVIGSGEVHFDPPGGEYVQGAEVVITATPDNGWRFKGWGGGLSGLQNPDTLTVNGAITFTATFEKASLVDAGSDLTFALSQNYPNPFNSSTRIVFAQPVSAHTKIVVYDALGRIIRVPADEMMSPGRREFFFDARDAASGLYFVHVESGEFSAVQKMTLLR